MTLSSVETVFHVDTYIAHATAGTYNQVTTGINACLAAAAAASLIQGTCPVVQFGPGSYVTNGPVFMVNGYGVVIRGAGINGTIINPASGSGGGSAFALINCSYCKVWNMSVFSAPVTAVISGSVLVGATSITLSSPISVTSGQFVGLQNAAQTLGEVVVTSSTGTLSTIAVTATRNAYTTSDTLMHGIKNAFQVYADNSQAGGGGTHNEFHYCAVSAAMYGWSIECAGGTGSASDHNNDVNVFDHCQCVYTPIAALNIGHSQSLLNEVIGGSFNGTYGIQCLTGGSFSVFGGGWSVTGCTFTLGGVIGRPGTISGLVISDTSAELIEARASDNMSVANLTFVGISGGGAGARSLPNAPVIDVTGTNFQLQFVGGQIGNGGAGNSYYVYFRDITGSGSSFVSFHDVNLWAYGGTADGVCVVTSGTTTWCNTSGGTVQETIAHNGVFLGMTAGAVNNYKYPAHRIGEIYGYSVTENITPISANYTVDSGSVANTGVTPDHVILVDNSASAITVTIPGNATSSPAQYRPGRVLRIIAKTDPATHNITITPATPGVGTSQVNGASSLVMSSGGVGATVELTGDGTNWWGR